MPAAVASSRGSAADIKPYHAKPVKPYSGHASTQKVGAGSARMRVAAFMGSWRLWVPGATYQRPTSNPGEVEQVTSAGAKGKTLTVLTSGRYSWHGITGRWEPTGDPDYPIVLRRALDGHDWKVGAAPRSAKGAQIVVWDGFTWEFGKRG